MISLTALLAAIWVGLWFAGLFVAPIRRLISAAQEVARGNLSVELPIRRGEGDLRRLSINFNAMTKELERQRTELVDANESADRAPPVHGGGAVGRLGRRASASTAMGDITLANRSAQKLLGREETELVGQQLASRRPRVRRCPQGAGRARTPKRAPSSR